MYCCSAKYRGKRGILQDQAKIIAVASLCITNEKNNTQSVSYPHPDRSGDGSFKHLYHVKSFYLLGSWVFFS